MLMLLLTGTLFLVFISGNASAQQAPKISDVRISNPGSSSVTISWVASSPSLGRVDYGPTQAYGETAYDNSCRMNGVVMVVVSGLAHDTSYYYMITATATNNNVEDTVTGTFKTAKEGFGQPYSAYGQILCMDGSPASSTMVYVTVEHQGVKSLPLSDMTSSEGYWSVDLTNLKDTNGGVYQWYNGDSIKIEAQGGTLGYGVKQGTIGLPSYYSQIYIGIPDYLRPVASLSASSTVIKIGGGVTFDASNSEGNITGYFFDFGDGTNSGWRTDPVVAHVFLTSGTYNVSLKVKDNGYESNNIASVIITVTSDQSSEPEGFIPSFEATYLLAIIGICSILLKGRKKKEGEKNE